MLGGSRRLLVRSFTAFFESSVCAREGLCTVCCSGYAGRVMDGRRHQLRVLAAVFGGCLTGQGHLPHRSRPFCGLLLVICQLTISVFLSTRNPEANDLVSRYPSVVLFFRRQVPSARVPVDRRRRGSCGREIKSVSQSVCLLSNTIDDLFYEASRLFVTDRRIRRLTRQHGWVLHASQRASW